VRRLLVPAWIAVAVAECVAFGGASAQPNASIGADAGEYRLYKFEQPIGGETWRLRRDGDLLVLTDTFSFTDRGTRVPLETTFRAASDLTPQSFDSKGRASRFAAVDVSLRVDRGSAMIRQARQTREATPPRQFFVVNGYSPIAQQMLMMRYWLQHQSPAELPILPQGTTVRILPRGVDTVTVNGKEVALTRYSVAGLIWGREMLWLDPAQRLVAAVTTDAEFDHFEAIAEGYEPLLGQFVAEAGRDGMAVLAELSRRLRTAPTGPLAVTGAVVVDGTGRPPIPDATIVVDGGRIVAVGAKDGVTIPAGATVFDAHGKTILPGHREIELYVEAGFTPLEAIQAATVVPAQVMGLSREVGTVEAGKRADFIVLDANPLDDIHNIRSVRHVVANGVVYPTARLWESVGFTP
jgi:hypothetical protein